MRFIALVIGPNTGEDYPPPPADAVAKMSTFNQKLVDRGSMIDGNGLQPPSRGARISFSDGKVAVADGPFSEAKEVIGGYWILDFDTLAEAKEWVAQAPMHGDATIELREIFAMEDHTPEVQAAAKLEGFDPR